MNSIRSHLRRCLRPSSRPILEHLEERSLLSAAGDFNGDGYADLAIGVPMENVGSLAIDAGAVNVIYGSDSGLTATGSQIWTQDSAGIADRADVGEHFGAALAVGDFDGDGYDDLAIGVPDESFSGNRWNAGAVHVLYGSRDGLTSSASQFWAQNTSGIAGTAERDDRFGAALAAGDFDNDGNDDLAIGVPGEKVGSVVGAGAVNVLYGSLTGLRSAGNQLWTQDSAGILDTAEIGDHFGFSLAAGDFDGDGRDDLVIGVPGENVIRGGTAYGDSGAVNAAL